MSTTGNVQITVVDSNAAAVLVPGSNVAFVMGCCSAGTANTLVATANTQTLTTNLGYGPLVEQCGLLVLSGATVIACPLAIATAGVATGTGRAAVSLTTASSASPIVVTAAAHGLITGEIVTISGVISNTGANGTFIITVTGANTFTLNGSTGTGSGTGGTAQPTGLEFTNAVTPGSSVITATMAATTGCYDDYLVELLVTTGGTVGTGPIAFQLSLDAGRNFGPIIQLGTANTYAIPNTGITLNFAAGTLNTNDTLKMACTAPQWNTAGVSAGLTAFQRSQYAVGGVGMMQLVGPVASGANASTIEGYLDTLATGYIFNRLLCNTVDVTTPQAWGGAGGQTEAAWMTAIESSYAAVSSKRISVAAGHYNVPSAYANPVAGSPAYRRPGQWAAACRQAVIPPQRHSGRVKDGALSLIVVNPSSDPTDGFVYHDERLNPGLDANRFTSFWTRIGLPGFFVLNPNLMSPGGSTLTLLPLGNVLDIACDIVHQVGQQQIDSDIRLNANGTIYVNDALALTADFNNALQAQMVATGMISDFTVQVDQTNNVLLTSTVNVTVSIVSRGYVLQENVTIGFNTVAA